MVKISWDSELHLYWTFFKEEWWKLFSHYTFESLSPPLPSHLAIHLTQPQMVNAIADLVSL